MHRSTSYIYIIFCFFFHSSSLRLLRITVNLVHVHIYSFFFIIHGTYMYVCTKKLSWHLAFLAMLCEVSYKYLSSFCSCCLM